jgi:hypothetical protein
MNPDPHQPNFKRLKLKAGLTLAQACKEAQATAHASGVSVHFMFSGVPMWADGHERPKDIMFRFKEAQLHQQEVENNRKPKPYDPFNL